MKEQDARRILAARGMPAVLQNVGRDAGSPFRDLSWSDPDYLKAEELERLVPGLAGLCPIAEQNGEAVIGLLPRSNQFVRYYYEDARQGDAGIEVLGDGFEQFAATVLLAFEESGLREELEEAADLLQFGWIDDLLALLDADPYDDAAVDRFVASLASSP